MSNVSKKMLMAAAGAASSIDYPAFIMIYGGSGVKLYAGEDNNDVTSSYISSPTLVSTAGGMERVSISGTNQRYIGFGSWGRSPAKKGAVADRGTSNSTWTQYSNFNVSLPGTGNDSVNRVTPSSDGARVAVHSGNGTDKGIFSFTSPSTEYGSQPSQFAAAAATTVYFSQGNYLWTVEETRKWSKFLFTANTLVHQGTVTFSGTDEGKPADGRVTLTSDGTKACTVSKVGIISIVDITGSSASISSTKNAGFSYSVYGSAISPDGSKVLICRNTADRVYVYDVAADTITGQTLKSGWAQARADVSWFADNDTYAVTGTSSNSAWVGSASNGGWLYNINSGTSVGGYNIDCLFS